MASSPDIVVSSGMRSAVGAFGRALQGVPPNRLGAVVAMGVTAENLARKHQATRETQDALALESHRRAARAIAEGRFKSQIVPVEVSAQACAVAGELRLPPERTNPNGGAIALGHPVGASGAIITVKLIHELHRFGGRYGLATMCIGGGQGIALVVERL